MFGLSQNIRTGIALGRQSVQLVRARGNRQVDKFTHLGCEDMELADKDLSPQAAAEALDRLLDRLDLHPSQLGRIAVAVGGSETTCRQVSMPVMTEEELAQALPLEVRKHLDLEGMESPVVDFQVLGSGVPEAGQQPQMQVLLAATSLPRRNFPLEVLRRCGLEPDVVDLAALARLNALLAVRPELADPSRTAGLLHLEGSSASLHLWHRQGGLLSRNLAGLAEAPAGPEATPDLTAAIQETLTYFRGRYRREADHLFLAGSGVTVPALPGWLGTQLGMPVTVLDPLGSLADSARSAGTSPENTACFTTACGLCRWWDREH